MRKIAISRFQDQKKVNAYFQSQSSYWNDIYTSGSVQGEVYRGRHTSILDWIDDLTLTSGSEALDIGCGAGLMSIALAQRGFRVRAVDSAEAMVEQAHRHVEETGAVGLQSIEIGDVYALAFEDESFDLVVALGVIPWLERPGSAIQEMARVTRPGGYIILTADNRARLNNLLDPWLNPLVVPLKRGLKVSLLRLGLRHQSPENTEVTFHSRHFIDKALTGVGLVKARSMTLGFGPFTLFRHTVVPEPLGTTLHYKLQRFADRNVPGFRSAGAHYIVLAKKPSSQQLVTSMNAEMHVS